MSTPSSAGGCTWIADRIHRECGGDRIVRLVELVPEGGDRRRRGRPRKVEAPEGEVKKKGPSSYYCGICETCGMPRLLAYRPRLQMALALPEPVKVEELEA